MLADTDISAVLPKDSVLKQRKRENRNNGAYDPRLDEKISPAKKSYVQNEIETLLSLCDKSVKKEQVLDYRNQELFFAKGDFDHIKVSPLVRALQEFVTGLPESYPDNDAFFVGPNLISRKRTAAVFAGEPTSPFLYVQLHNLIRAAKKKKIESVLAYTEHNISTQSGFQKRRFVPSIWVPKPRLLKEALDQIGEDHTSTVVNKLREDHELTVTLDLFSRYLLREICAKTKREKIAYGVTQPFAKTLYSVLEKLLKGNGYTLPSFGLMFPSRYDETHRGRKRVEALPISAGNIV